MDAINAWLYKYVVNVYGLVVVGALMVGFGLFGANGLLDNTVSCHGHVMTPAETCTTTRRLVTRTYTYDEWRSQNHLMSRVFTGGGAAALVVGLTLIVLRRRKATAS